MVKQTSSAKYQNSFQPNLTHFYPFVLTETLLPSLNIFSSNKEQECKNLFSSKCCFTWGIKMGKRRSNTKNGENLSQLTNIITLCIVVHQQEMTYHWNHNCKRILLMYQIMVFVNQILIFKPPKVKSSQQLT